MNRRRISQVSLSTTRIYQKYKRFYFFSAQEIVNPKTGKIAKWHNLCHIEEGEELARQIAKEIKQFNDTANDKRGNMPGYLAEYLKIALKKRGASKPEDIMRLKLWEQGNKELGRMIGKISDAFSAFDVNQVLPQDVAKFVDQWIGRRTAQVYLSCLSVFFRWCARRGLRADNPCTLVDLEKPQTRDRYITDEEYHRIRDALLIGEDGRPTPSGPMIQCYVDLCYLLYQRTTEVRLLQWEQIKPEGIYFKPTKTERSSAAKVLVPMTDALKEILERVRKLNMMKGTYVIQTRNGHPYTTSGIGSAWERACKRAGMENTTLKDLRPKAITDGNHSGYSIEQLMVGAAHTDTEMTKNYIKRYETPVSEVRLDLPKPKLKM